MLEHKRTAARRALKFGTLVCACLFWLAGAQGHAAPVELRLSPKLIATADYVEGKRGKPAIVVVHGFLQTRDFPTIARLAQGLAEQGYTVLAPTLTLGVPRRNQSLACEAIHTHSFEGDVAELGAWVNWLRARGHREIIMIGHSFGSLQSLAYAASPSARIDKVIALSLVDNREVSNRASIATLREAKRRAALGVTGLMSPPFSYCKEFPTTPANYVSYASWDRTRILGLIKSVRVPMEIIVGSKDARMGADWPERLRAQGASVHSIEGANHFFDDQYEFDLLELVLGRLN